MKTNESYHQKKVVAYLNDLKIQGLVIDFFAVENENPFSKFISKEIIFKMENNSKKMGKNKGASDLVIILKNKVLFLEMKDAPKQLKTKVSISHTKKSDEQIKFIDNVNKSSCCVAAFCYGYDEAKRFIDTHII